MIEITEVRVTHKVDARLRAFVSITLGGCFVVRGLKIIAGKEGRLFVAMPSRRKADETYQDIAHPITPEFRNYLEDRVIGEYNASLKAGVGERANPTGDAEEP